ncbi:hypothetical protein HDU76_001292 [Blyttiomyces sp. JEL0837]|nr:hypothetical protein HDU76_001292 [Blyttiomyces sp. JEL0837]
MSTVVASTSSSSPHHSSSSEQQPPQSPQRLTIPQLPIYLYKYSRFITRSDGHGGHLDNAIAVTYLSDAIFQFWNDIIPHKCMDDYYRVEWLIRYLAPLKTYTTPTIEIGVKSIHRSSFRLSLRIGDAVTMKPHIVAEVVHVLVDPVTGKGVPVEEDLRGALERVVEMQEGEFERRRKEDERAMNVVERVKEEVVSGRGRVQEGGDKGKRNVPMARL